MVVVGVMVSAFQFRPLVWGAATCCKQLLFLLLGLFSCWASIVFIMLGLKMLTVRRGSIVSPVNLPLEALIGNCVYGIVSAGFSLRRGWATKQPLLLQRASSYAG